MLISTNIFYAAQRRVSLNLSHPPLQCLRHFQNRNTFSTPSTSLVKVRSIKAPHIGVITILTLASPSNKNAISRQLLSELLHEIDVIRWQWNHDPKASGRPEFHDLTSANSHWPHTAGDSKQNSNLDDGDSIGTSQTPLVPQAPAVGTRVLIINSDVDKVFCAGADLKERAGMSYQETQEFLTTLREVLGRLATLPVPTIAAVSGFALGGGLELALATTFRVFSTTAIVGLPETRLGIIPGAGGVMRLKDTIGRQKAADLILTGRRVDGREAHALGICERLVVKTKEQAEIGGQHEQKADETLEAAVKMAEDICEGAPIAISAGLNALGTGLEARNGQWENEMYEKVVNTEDRNEALVAFREKRKPKFKGA